MAQADGLVVFCQNSRLIERYRERDRAGARPRRQLLPAGPGGRGDRPATSSRSRCTDKPPRRHSPNETIDGFSLAGAARDHRFRLLVRLAGQARQSAALGRGVELISTRPAAVARSDPERLQAQLLLADVLLDAGRPGKRSRSASGS